MRSNHQMERNTDFRTFGSLLKISWLTLNIGNFSLFYGWMEEEGEGGGGFCPLCVVLANYPRLLGLALLHSTLYWDRSSTGIGAALHRHVQHCTALHRTAPHCTGMCCTALHCYVQHCTIQGLQFTLLFPSVPQIFPAFLKIRFKTREILPNYYWEIRCQNRPCFDL